jgi:hypothetical protein
MDLMEIGYKDLSQDSVQWRGLFYVELSDLFFNRILWVSNGTSMHQLPP